MTRTSRSSQPLDEAQDLLDPVLTKLQEWLESAIALIPNLMVALLVVALFGIASRLVRKGVNKALTRTTGNKTISRMLSIIAGVVVLVVGLFFALGVLKLEKTVTSLLAGAGVIGLALAFAFQDLAANFLAGLYLSIKRPLKIGEIVETNDTFGTVDRIDLRNTVLKRPTGEIVFLPNKLIFENKLTNFSRAGERRVDLPVGVTYAADLPAVETVAREAVEALPMRDAERPVEVFFTEFGGSSIDLVVRFWIAYARQAEYLEARSAAIQAIHRAFDEHGITIPFPIRTLDFGIEGGATLAEMLSSGGAEAGDAGGG